MNNTGIQLLLADDDKDDCVLFSDALEELEYRTALTTASNGEQLMQVLYKTADTLPDVLFLDLNMPRKNGFECLTEIKSDERLKKLPVIIFSTSFDKEIIELLQKNGAKHYIRKPNEFEHLKKVIHEAISSVTQTSPLTTSSASFILQA